MAASASKLVVLGAAIVLASCGGASEDAVDAGEQVLFDARDVRDAAGGDARPATDAQPSMPDASATRTTLLPGFCPGTPTAPGLYEGTLASNLNDLSGCDGLLSAPGRDGAVRLELAAGATVTATFRHAGDGALYILDACPVTSSCLDSSDSSISGPETVTYTNDTGSVNTIYVVLDSDELGGPQTFELDLAVD